MEKGERITSRRLIALGLCICMVLSLLSGIVLFDLNARAAEDTLAPTSDVERQADVSTMDTYTDWLNLNESSRYAGRLWSDKTVFAYGQTYSGAEGSGRSFSKDTLQLTKELDGYSGTIKLNSDFLHVFSVLASSQAVDQSVPVDLVLALDISGSMGSSVVNETVDWIYTGPENTKAIGYYIGHDSTWQSAVETGSNEASKDLNGVPDKVIAYPTEYNKEYGQLDKAKVDAYNKYLEFMNRLIDGIIGRAEDTQGEAGDYGVISDDGETRITTFLEKMVSENKDYQNDWIPVEKRNKETYQTMYNLIKTTIAKNQELGEQNINAWYSDAEKNRNASWPIDGWPIEEALNTNPVKNINNAPNRMYHVINAANEFIESFMELNEKNRISVVVYDSVATVLMPLAHYSQVDNGDYLKAEKHHWQASWPQWGCTVTATARPAGGYDQDDKDEIFGERLKGNVYTATVTSWSNTDTMAALSAAMDILQTADDFYSDIGKDRLPAVVLMTDGAANTILTGNGEDVEIGSQDSVNSFATILKGTTGGSGERVDKINKHDRLTISDGSTYTKLQGDEKTKTRTDSGLTVYAPGGMHMNGSSGELESVSTIATLLNASYMKTLVEKRYNPEKEYKEGDENWISPLIYTIGYDIDEYADDNKGACYALLDPENYFLKGRIGKYVDREGTSTQDADKFPGSWQIFEKWKEGGKTELEYLNWIACDAISGEKIENVRQKIIFDGTSDTYGTEPNTVKKADIVRNISYVTEFFEAKSGLDTEDTIGEVFDEILAMIRGAMFSPVGGENDLGAQNSVTYMDPMGKYMEVKDIDSMVLFGQHYPVVKAGVYDYEFNAKYMSGDSSGNYTTTDDAGQNIFRRGWYNSKDGSFDSSQDDRTKLPTRFKSADEARANGWEFYLDHDTIQQFIPSLKETTVGNMSTKQQKTVYTVYRFKGDNIGEDDDDIELKDVGNPCYGENADGEPNVTFRISDIRIWVEDTGNYEDEGALDSGVMTDTSYDEALFVDIPADAMPMRTVTVTHDASGKINYTTNLGDKSHGDLPLRVFYSVGMEDDVLYDDNSINLASGISPEYIEKFKYTEDKEGLKAGDVVFFSNWYNSSRRYDGYVSVSSETGYTYGDPVVTFSPDGSNRYYMTQKAITLYATTTEEQNGGAQPKEKILNSDEEFENFKKTHQTITDSASANDWYWVPYEYYVPTTTGKDATYEAKMVRVAVARKGAEFGSGVGSHERAAYLCWYNQATGETADYTTGTGGNGKPTTGSNGDWVVALSSGSLRIGDMAQDVRSKDYSSGNATYTANNFYLPTVSTSTTTGDRGSVIINTYLGNNGRLAVSDTDILVTKTVDPGQFGIVDGDKAYNFQIQIDSISGDRDVVEVSNVNGVWVRRMAYVDLTLNGQYLLQTSSASLAKVDEDGKPDDNGEYYVYVGPDPSASEGGGTTYRLYTYSDKTIVGDAGTMGNKYVTATQHMENGEADGTVDFSLKNVWLVPVEKVDKGEFEAVEAGKAPTGGQEKTNFHILNYNPTDQKSSRVVLVTDYLTKSALKTRSLTFEKGVATFQLEDGEGLLFTGIKRDTPYTVSELLSKEDVEKGYVLEKLESGVAGSTKTSKPEGTDDTDNGNYTYSASGTTGYVEQQAHYTNIVIPDILNVSKTLEAEDKTVVLTDTDKDTEFTYTVTFDTEIKITPKYWKGKTEDIGNAPKFDPASSSFTGYEGLTTLEKSDGKYTFTLKDGETILIYGLPLGTKYTVTEEKNENYPVNVEKGGSYVISGTIERSFDLAVGGAITGNSVNTAAYTNVKPPKDTSLSVTKEVIPAEGIPEDPNKLFEFTVTLTPKDGGSLESSYPVTVVPEAEGNPTKIELKELTEVPGTWTGTFSIKAGQTFTITGLPNNFDIDYTITEKGDPHYAASASSETITSEPAALAEDTSISGTIPAGTEGAGVLESVKFTNTRLEPTPVYTYITLEKTMNTDSSTFEFKEGLFFFTVTPDANNPASDPLKGEAKTVSNGAPDTEGKATAELFTEDEEFTEEGVYTYTISEVKGNLAGVTYTGKTYTVTVTVTPGKVDTEHNTYKLDAAYTITCDGKTVETIDFVNEYHIGKIDASIEASKTLTGGTLTAGEFSFTLTAGEAKADGLETSPLPNGATEPITVTNGADGKVSFGSITYEKVGTYNYTISEVKGTRSDTTYDETVYNVVVTVADGGNGALTASVTYNGGTEAVFTNIHLTGGLTVSKTVSGEGADLNKEFHFTVTLDDTTISGEFGDMVFEGGVAHVTLKHGQSVTATGLPAGVGYNVTEDEASRDGYITNATGETGTLTEAGAVAHFVNSTGKNTKTETNPGADAQVTVGQEITYQIHWFNDQTVAADVTVVDLLDPGVDFVSADNGGNYNPETHTVTWALGNQPAGASGTVTLTVRVNKNAVTSWGYNSNYEGAVGVGNDYRVVNRAKVEVGNVSHYTKDVENPVPEKTETTPGDGVMVGIGEEITYSIHWKNTYDEQADVVIVDPLDPGVDYVSSDHEGVYDKGEHKVTWTFTAGANSEGVVTLTVKVNEKAYQAWEYNDNADSGSGTSGDEKDYEVLNRARVQVKDHSAYTATVENPVPEKKETAPGIGQTVEPGNEITYEIHWTNGHDEAATVTITDELDKNVEFVSANNGGAYDERAHTVTWTLVDQPGHAVGTVKLTVKVKEGAVSAGKVENQAGVEVGNDDKVLTDIIPNPTGPSKTETQINGEDVSNLTPVDDGFTGPGVKVGDTVTYQITWVNNGVDENGQPAEATIKIVDPLDDGVDFDSASDGGTYDSAAHAVTWDLGKQPASATGSVTLTVKVNEKAYDDWNYNPGEDSGEPGEGRDNEIVNRASVSALVENMPERKVFTDTIHNPLKVGNLKVSKTVEGSGDKTKEFNFTVTLSDTSISGTYGDMEFTEGVAEFTLTHDQSKTATGLPAGITYTVTETEANQEGYETSSTGDTGTIPEDGTAEAAFVNTKPVTPPPTPSTGGLTVSKTVTGQGDKEKVFNFTVTLSDTSISGTYGDMEFTEGVAKFTLTHGQSKTATDLPAGITYTVKEAEANQDGYSTRAEGDEGTIPENDTAEAKFVNSKGKNTKTETKPGADEQVSVGQEIIYEISWFNDKTQDATVKVVDLLDPGVDFVEASDKGAYDSATHTVTWNLGTQEAEAAGTVTLTVRVNEKAVNAWGYGGEVPDPDKDGKDHRVVNRAEVVVDNVSDYTNEVENPVPEKTETTPGKHEDVLVGDEIEYKIHWKNTYDDEAQVTITDPLDPGVDFVEVSNGGSYDAATHKVTWSFKAAAGTEGDVTLKVRVNENAFDTWTYDEGKDSGTAGTGEDGKVVNRAKVQVGNSSAYTDVIENPVPDKTETDPGADALVLVGQEITYKIHWFNDQTVEADVTVVDELDPGVDFVEASDKGVYDSETHTVTWLFEKQEAGASGIVTLKVRVNEKAVDAWGYDGEVPDPDKDGKDYRVVNRAEVKVGNNSHYTNEVENPVFGKTETDPGADAQVTVGQEITYEISWFNDKTGPAKVTVVDLLDPGVDFVEASEKGAYDNATHTVTWNLGEQEAGATGTVTLTVRVNNKAVNAWGYDGEVSDPDEDGKDHRVVDRAEILVDNDSHYTNEVENPVPEKTEIDPGEYEDVHVGDVIEYMIHWKNTYDVEAQVTITDPLDKGVDFVEAGNDGSYDAATRTVTWSFKAVANTEGDVTLKVRVNEDAFDTWTYDEGKDSGSAGLGEDGKVVNRAKVQVGNSSAYTDVIENPVPGKTETDPGANALVSVGQEITYEIHWFNDKTQDATVKVVDLLDPGVDFVEASDKGAYDSATHTVTWNLGTQGPGKAGVVTLKVRVNEKAFAKWGYNDKYEGIEGEGDDYKVVNRAAVIVDNDSHYTNDVENPLPGKTEIDPGADALVTVGQEITYEIHWFNDKTEKATVKVVDRLDPGVDFVKAPGGSYDKDSHTVTWDLGTQKAGATGTVKLTVRVNKNAVKGWGYSGDNKDPDYRVVNRAEVLVDNEPHYTNEVENPVPEKTEIDPGDGVMVGVGEEITYSIHWKNTYDEQAEVVIVDPLDPGVDYVSSDNECKYDKGTHTVTWTFTAEPNTEGDVKLTVKVNEKAYQTWKYKDGEDSGSDGEGKDYEVLNRARVQVKDHSAYTATVENPVPEKRETTPGIGQTVKPGDKITYEIHWTNGHDEAATVTITDPLDKNVKFVSADNGGKYDEKSHTVTWTLADRQGHAEGVVTLTVEVLEGAVSVGKVENQAGVQVGNDAEVKTGIIPNPTGPSKTETEINGEDVSGDLEPVDGGFTGPKVDVGDEVTYKITWVNNGVDKSGQPTAAKITIVDRLDEGVDFLEASDGGKYDSEAHAVTWDLGEQPASATGSVTLKVRVNEKAYDNWQYGDGDSGEPGDGRDNEIVNRASVSVQVGNEPEEKVITDTIHNPLKVGNLKVTKTVTGSGSKTKEFHFTVTLDDDTINGEYGEMTFEDGVAEFTLKHGESKTATGLPAGVGYTVTEEEANKGGYKTRAEGDEGTIPEGGTAEAEFVNSKSTTPPPTPSTGGLTVTKTVTGEGDRNKEFHFTVTLSDRSINGVYGQMTFVNGVATFTLRHGEAITAYGLPANISYTVTEAEANRDGYTTTVTGGTGTILPGLTVEADFVNDLPEEPETPPEEPEIPPNEPDTPPEEPDTPPHEPDKPTDEPDTPPDKPENPGEPDETPKTSDESRQGLWLFLMIASAMGLTVTTVLTGRNMRLVSRSGKHRKRF